MWQPLIRLLWNSFVKIFLINLTKYRKILKQISTAVKYWLTAFITFRAFTVTYTQAEHRIGTKIRRMKIRHNKIRNQNTTSITLLSVCYQVLFHYLLLLLFQFCLHFSAALASKPIGSVHCLYMVFP